MEINIKIKNEEVIKYVKSKNVEIDLFIEEAILLYKWVDKNMILQTKPDENLFKPIINEIGNHQESYKKQMELLINNSQQQMQLLTNSINDFTNISSKSQKKGKIGEGIIENLIETYFSEDELINISS